MILFGILALGIVNPTYSQTDTKKIKKQLKKRALKQARKEAKSMKKLGYSHFMGDLPLDKQLEQAYFKQLAKDEKGTPLFFTANGNSVAGTVSAAEIQALEIAKLNLAGQVETKIIASIEQGIANKQLNREDAATISKIVVASRNMIAQELGMVYPIMKAKRNTGDKNVECDVKIAYSFDHAHLKAKKVISEQLEKEIDNAQAKLDNLMSH